MSAALMTPARAAWIVRSDDGAAQDILVRLIEAKRRYGTVEGVAAELHWPVQDVLMVDDAFAAEFERRYPKGSA